MTVTQPTPNNEEHALRLLVNSIQLQGKRVTSAAFKTKKPDHVDYRPVSVFMRERLPDETGDCLHIGKFASAGRASLKTEYLRATVCVKDEKEVSPFDLLLTPEEAIGDLAAFKDAHGRLEGPTWHTPSISALAVQVNEKGAVERLLADEAKASG